MKHKRKTKETYIQYLVWTILHCVLLSLVLSLMLYYMCIEKKNLTTTCTYNTCNVHVLLLSTTCTCMNEYICVHELWVLSARHLCMHCICNVALLTCTHMHTVFNMLIYVYVYVLSGVYVHVYLLMLLKASIILKRRRIYRVPLINDKTKREKEEIKKKKKIEK